MHNNYDIAVIGGGPAGLIAAAAASADGAKVALLEKTSGLGRKLLLTGGTRCNLTNIQFTKDRLAELFGPSGKFLFSGLAEFGVEQTLEYFNRRGLSTKEEANGCIFTQSNNAQTVLALFEDTLMRQNVSVYLEQPVKNIVKENSRINKLILSELEITAKQYIVCTGGLSFPNTGSTGDGLHWAETLGHTLTPTRPALAPIILQESWVQELQGLSIPQAALTLYYQSKKQKVYHGDILFTEKGLTGPLIHNLSRMLGELLETGSVQLGLDCLPELTSEKLDQKLQLELPNNKMLRNYLDSLIAKRLVDIVLAVCRINPEKPCNAITKAERNQLVHKLKQLNLTVLQIAGYDKAMITVGGINLKEMEAKTMRSKLIENLYFAGEILDLDGPSGGYNLQVCWTTGHIAGNSAAQKQVES